MKRSIKIKFWLQHDLRNLTRHFIIIFVDTLVDLAAYIINPHAPSQHIEALPDDA